MIAQIFFLILAKISRIILNRHVESGHFLFLILRGIFFFLFLLSVSLPFCFSLSLKTMYQVKGFFSFVMLLFYEFLFILHKIPPTSAQCLVSKPLPQFCVATSPCFQVAMSVLLFNLLVSGLLY